MPPNPVHHLHQPTPSPNPKPLIKTNTPFLFLPRVKQQSQQLTLSLPLEACNTPAHSTFPIPPTHLPHPMSPWPPLHPNLINCSSLYTSKLQIAKVQIGAKMQIEWLGFIGQIQGLQSSGKVKVGLQEL